MRTYRWLQLEFNGSKTIDEIDVFTEQDNWQNPSEPTETMTFSLYGLNGFEVQYWNGSSWIDVSGGNVSGNNKVWRKFSFAALTTNKIRILANASADGYSRLTEVEAWTARTNVALTRNGGQASASTSYPSTPSEDDNPGTTTNGDRTGKVGSIPSVWNDAAPANSFPDWLEVEFSVSQTIGEIDVFTIQDNWQNPSEPTETMSFNNYGLTSYEVQYWDGSAWLTVPNGSVTGNNKVWRKFTFTPIATNKIRVLTSASGDGYSRIAELEAWTASSGSASANINWLVTDQLGTPRMIFDKSGSLGSMKRHDYLPFGEELFAGTGGRSMTQGYSGDSVRQKFTEKERDIETNLDYFGARYFSSTEGRFTSADPIMIKKSRLLDPQRINLYAFARNNPLKFIDPDGADLVLAENLKPKQREFIVKNLARLYMTEKGRAIIDRVDKTPFVVTLGRAELTRKDLNPAKPGEIKFGGTTYVVGGVTQYESTTDPKTKEKTLIANGSTETGMFNPIRVAIDKDNSSDIGKDPATVMAHELGGHTTDLLNLADKPGAVGTPGFDITGYNDKNESSSEKAEKWQTSKQAD